MVVGNQCGKVPCVDTTTGEATSVRASSTAARKGFVAMVQGICGKVVRLREPRL